MCRNHSGKLAKWIQQRKKLWLQKRVGNKLKLDAPQLQNFQALYDATADMQHISTELKTFELDDVLSLQGINQENCKNMLEQVINTRIAKAEQVIDKFTVFYDSLTQDQRLNLKNYINHFHSHCIN